MKYLANVGVMRVPKIQTHMRIRFVVFEKMGYYYPVSQAAVRVGALDNVKMLDRVNLMLLHT
jgi:hypothetical protein|tara:strand:- start:3875 stop:4060 length:186 start_codon:yes stop_codon:yes gene_type:complete